MKRKTEERDESAHLRKTFTFLKTWIKLNRKIFSDKNMIQSDIIKLSHFVSYFLFLDFFFCFNLKIEIMIQFNCITLYKFFLKKFFR